MGRGGARERERERGKREARVLRTSDVIRGDRLGSIEVFPIGRWATVRETLELSLLF